MTKRHLKRLAARYAVAKKAAVFAIKPAPGPHPERRAVPLAAALIALGFARTRREVKAILTQRRVFVDGKVVVDPKRPIGLMDVVQIGDSFWRAGIDSKGRIAFEKVDAKEAEMKICRVEKKIRVTQGIQLTLHDGRTLLNYPAAVGDSVVVSIPDGTPTKHIPLKVGARCLVIGGTHVGQIGEVLEFVEKTKEIKYKIGEKIFLTVKRNIFPIS